ncbi:transposase [Thiohalocapsa sp. ML1]|uniref:IS91 family transposase n=1 Tax=Thiohalocapsa sp. ML1 TaxID=1431688 RepID=UPI0009EC06C9|nr:transposase [Thiohalocapsa sp. ML1]
MPIGANPMECGVCTNTPRDFPHAEGLVARHGSARRCRLGPGAGGGVGGPGGEAGARDRADTRHRRHQRAAWVDARELELLPIQYFHLVFTLPDALDRLVQYHPSAVYAALMRAAAETLQTFARKRWDGDLGIVAVLHTWGQTLQLHPHVHCLVTGGALKRDGSAFVRAPQNFRFPTLALSPVFRAIFLRALEHLRAVGTLAGGPPELADHGDWKQLLIRLHRHDWVVHAEAPFDAPQHLIRYLGRYVNRVAIANHRILDLDDGRVTFRYRDNRCKDPHSRRPRDACACPARNSCAASCSTCCRRASTKCATTACSPAAGARPT